MEPKSNKKIVITSGYFNPLHIGHINLISEAKKLGDYLIVVVNNDKQVKFKGSTPFMKEDERVGIIKNLKFVDEVFLSIDVEDGYQSKSLESLAKRFADCEVIFAKGGDRKYDNLPECEQKICGQYNIKVIGEVGGGKVQSSSWLLARANAKQS